MSPTPACARSIIGREYVVIIAISKVFVYKKAVTVVRDRHSFINNNR